MKTISATTGFFLSLVLFMTGCAKEDTAWLVDGHAFIPPASHSSNFPEPLKKEKLEREKEKPIVKILNGTEVSGIDEARQMVGRQQAPPADLSQEIKQLALEDVSLVQAAALLTELCGYNIAVTGKAASTRVTLFLENLPLRQALEAVCRLNGLWYREDERIITLMTAAEYADEMVIHRNEKTRAFWLRYTNANDMAKVIQAVMGAQVEFVDIGAEKIYGHVQEEPESGGAVAGEESEILTEEEKKKLLALGLIRDGAVDALEVSSQIGKNVPAVITVFKRNNSILARSLDDAILGEIGRIIEAMDTPTNQVLLEMTILQVTLGDGFESFFQIDFPGRIKSSTPDSILDPDNDPLDYDDTLTRIIDYNKLGGSSMGSSLGLASKTFDVVFGNRNIQARMELFASEDRVEVLATPFLMSANNAKVEFFVGEETPLRDDVEVNTLYNEQGYQTTTTFEVTINREELGTDIEISSFINEDGTITMDIEAELSFAKYNMTKVNVYNDVTGEAIPFPLDGVDRSELTSVVTSASGQPLAIGGIIKEQLEEYEKKVPFLGDLPIVGFLFREIADKKSKTETVIILTPHIIRHPALAWQQSRDFLNRRSSHPRMVTKQENILDYPTADAPGEQPEETP